MTLSCKEVSSNLNIAASTLRKYSELFERSGYEFARNQNKRVYSKKDIHLLQTFLNRKGDNPRLTNEDVARELLKIREQQHLDVGDRQIDVLLRLENDIRQYIKNQQQGLENILTRLDILQKEQIEILKLHTTDQHQLNKILMDFKNDILEATRRKSLFKK